MTISLTHTKVSALPDDPVDAAAGDVLPSDWNAGHVLTQATGKLLGRSTAGTGAVEEISPSSPLALAAGSLSITAGNLSAGSDTNVTLTVSGNLTGQLLLSSTVTAGWTGTLAAGRLNSNVVQGVTNDTNVTGTVAAQNLTLGWTGTLGVSRGGTGAGTLTAHGVLLGEGTGAVAATAAMTAGQILVGQGSSADPLPQTVGTDATLSAAGALTIAASAVTNAKMANMNGHTYKGNNTASAAAPADITSTQLTADLNQFTTSLQGLVPGSGGGTTNFMRADGTWAAPPAAAVSSVFTRTGAVVAAAGDYDITQIYKAKFFGHRVTLTTATPVLTANATAQGTVFLTPYQHDLISIYDGTRFVTLQLSEQSITLDATNFLSGKLYDVFVAYNSGTPFFGYGPAWTNITTRSAAIARKDGVWTNNASITLRSASGTTNTAAANTATLVGTIYATANAQTGMNFNPAATAGGNNSVLGVFNVFNRVPMWTRSRDNTASWTYNSATWRATDNNANNSVNFVDGLGEVAIHAITGVGATFNSSVTVTGQVGININSTSATPAVTAEAVNSTAQTAGVRTVVVSDSFLPAQGFNTITAMESGGTNIEFFFGTDTTQVQYLKAEVMI